MENNLYDELDPVFNQIEDNGLMSPPPVELSLGNEDHRFRPEPKNDSLEEQNPFEKEAEEGDQDD